MPVGTQWEVVAAAAAPLIPVFDELARQAAQGTVVFNDDTTMRILTLTQEARAEALPAGASADRTGVFTSGVVAETPNGLIALFKTGPCHAGEHLAEVLDLREVTDPPIHMSDASTRNRPGDHSTLAASCIPHARRNYVDVVEAFPEEVAFVPQRSSKRTHFRSRKLTHHLSHFLRAPTVFFASERGQGRAALFAARRSKPLTPRRGEYAGSWLCAQQYRAHNHDDNAFIPPSQVGQVDERNLGQFQRASRALSYSRCAPSSTPTRRPGARVFRPPSACSFIRRKVAHG
jgi:hypothetical protein